MAAAMASGAARVFVVQILVVEIVVLEVGGAGSHLVQDSLVQLSRGRDEAAGIEW